MSESPTRLVNQDIVMLGGPAWAAEAPGRLQRLAQKLAGQNRLLYVEHFTPPTSPRQIIAAVRAHSSETRQIVESLWVQSMTPLDAAMGKLGGGSRTLPTALRQLQFRRPLVLIGSLAQLDEAMAITHAALIGLLDPGCDTEDRLPDAVGLNAVIYTGAFTAPIGETPPIDVVPDGVDVDQLAAAHKPGTVVPADLLAVPRPVIGLVGPITRQIDLELIDALAQRRPYWSVVIIGNLEVDVTVLRDRSNILIFGPRPYADVPGYLKGLNVAILPLRPTCPMDTRSITTIQQYRAAGVPTVVSGLTPGLSFSAIASASGPGEFEAAIDAALNADPASVQRLNESDLRKLDWSAALEQIESAIARLLPVSG